MKKKTLKDLFLELAKPDKDGVSRWVHIKEFEEEYADLQFANGWSWGRGSSALAKMYNLEVIREKNKITQIRTNGLNDQEQFNQNIRKDIKDYYSIQPCVMLGVIGKSENTKIEVDHKEGTKDCQRVSQTIKQTLDDFQPLCKAANDAKRQICKKCKETNIRFDAKIIKGNPISYYSGNSLLTESGCIGCYQYDPVKYREKILDLARDGKI